MDTEISILEDSSTNYPINLKEACSFFNRSEGSLKRICEYLYFDGDTPKAEIESFAMDKFGDVAGYAQQYLFMYGQKHKIGTK